MRRVIGAAAVGVLLAGCASSVSNVTSTEDYLAAAGFRVLAGNTGGYAAAARQLPPHEFVHQVEQGIPTTYNFDPTVCGCLYYGSEQNWDAYNQELVDKRHMEAVQTLMKDNTPLVGDGR